MSRAGDSWDNAVTESFCSAASLLGYPDLAKSETQPSTTTTILCGDRNHMKSARCVEASPRSNQGKFSRTSSIT